MPRMIFGPVTPTDTYCAVEWKDANGPHGKRVTEDMPVNIRTAMNDLMAADPTVRQWVIQYVGPNVRARVVRDAQDNPVNFPLSGANLARATLIIDWAEGEVSTNLIPKQDRYEEERRLRREIDILTQRLAAL